MVCIYYGNDGSGIQTASDATPAHLRLLLGGTLYTVVPGLSTRVCPSNYSRSQQAKGAADKAQTKHTQALPGCRTVAA
jgi:hypothetical protein